MNIESSPLPYDMDDFHYVSFTSDDERFFGMRPSDPPSREPEADTRASSEQSTSAGNGLSFYDPSHPLLEVKSRRAELICKLSNLGTKLTWLSETCDIITVRSGLGIHASRLRSIEELVRNGTEMPDCKHKCWFDIDAALDALDWLTRDGQGSMAEGPVLGMKALKTKLRKDKKIEIRDYHAQFIRFLERHESRLRGAEPSRRSSASSAASSVLSFQSFKTAKTNNGSTKSVDEVVHGSSAKGKRADVEQHVMRLDLKEARLVLGHDFSNITQIEEVSGTRIRVFDEADHDLRQCEFHISGRAAGCVQAMDMINFVLGQEDKHNPDGSQFDFYTAKNSSEERDLYDDKIQGFKLLAQAETEMDMVEWALLDEVKGQFEAAIGRLIMQIELKVASML